MTMLCPKCENESFSLRSYPDVEEIRCDRCGALYDCPLPGCSVLADLLRLLKSCFKYRDVFEDETVMVVDWDIYDELMLKYREV